MTMPSGPPMIPYVSSATRAQWTVAILAIIAVIDVIAVFSDIAEIRLLNRISAGEFFSDQEADSNDIRQALVGLAQLVTFIAAAVAFLMWVHRSHRNLPALGAKRLDYSTGWAVGGYFVPIMSFVRPFRVMKEAWWSSEPSRAGQLYWRDQPTPSLVGWWWALFLATNLISNIAGRIAFSGDSVEEILAGSWAFLVSDTLDIPAALVAIALVRSVSARQEAKHRGLTFGGALNA